MSRRMFWRTRAPAAVGVLAALALSACYAGVTPRTPPVALDQWWTHPPRPRLPASADTNDAAAYIQWANTVIAHTPDSAAAAFYWASRLDPWRADAYYGRSVALLLTCAAHPEITYYDAPSLPTRRLRPDRQQVIDSLDALSMERDPFLLRYLDPLVTGSPPAFVVQRMRDPADRGYWAFAHGANDSAVALLGQAVRKHPERAPLHALRGIAFYRLEMFDSTVAELRTLIDTLAGRERRKLTLVYRPKAMAYYAIGLAHVQRGDTVQARLALEQAVVEDMSFYMAHVRLAGVALQRRDTAAAAEELARALQVRGDDPVLRHFEGTLLIGLGRTAEGVEELERAMKLDPDFAQPYHWMGRLYDASQDTVRAIEAYDAFLARATRDEPLRPWTTARRAALAAALAAMADTTQVAARTAESRPPE